MTAITVITQFPDRADVRSAEDLAHLGYIELVCQGITYKPTAISRVTGVANWYKCLFDVVTEPDTTTPTLSVSVSDALRVGEKLSG
jgi:hypothetical protein